MLLKKAHAALPKGGDLIVHEAIIDDDRSKNDFGLLTSLNMLIETPDGQVSDSVSPRCTCCHRTCSEMTPVVVQRERPSWSPVP